MKTFTFLFCQKKNPFFGGKYFCAFDILAPMHSGREHNYLRWLKNNEF